MFINKVRRQKNSGIFFPLLLQTPLRYFLAKNYHFYVLGFNRYTYKTFKTQKKEEKTRLMHGLKKKCSVKIHGGGGVGLTLSGTLS